MARANAGLSSGSGGWGPIRVEIAAKGVDDTWLLLGTEKGRCWERWGPICIATNCWCAPTDPVIEDPTFRLAVLCCSLACAFKVDRMDPAGVGGRSGCSQHC